MAIEKKEIAQATDTKTAKVETPVEAAPATAKVEKKAAAPKKAAEKKVAVPKAAAEKKAAAPKAAAEKKVAAPKAAEKKTAVPKAAVEKTTAPKAAVKKADPKTKVVVEYAGKQIVTKDIVAAATKSFTKANKGVAIKSIEVYVKPEENVAYYVVNGQGSDDYKVIL